MCMGCVEICSAVFYLNDDTGLIEVIEMDAYPESDIDEAIKYCPENAICWEQD
ncbi:MAG: ferredoxin [Desulfobacteraceae bacterium]|nr:ferredoxin [Desulfobacteraceae bacterium]